MLEHPETIKQMETNLSDLKLRRFENVECLLTRKFEAKNTLSSLPKLKELRYIDSIADAFRHLYMIEHEVGSLDRMKATLNEFMGNVRLLRESDFLFRFAGFQLTKTTLDQIDFGVAVENENGEETLSIEYVYLKNYHLIDDTLDFMDHLDFNRLPVEVPNDFFQKFQPTRLRRIEARGPVQDAH